MRSHATPLAHLPQPTGADALSRRDWLGQTVRCAALAAAPAALPWLAGCAAEPVFEPPPLQPAVRQLSVGQTLQFGVTNLYNQLVVGEASHRVLSTGPDGAATLAVRLPASNTYRIDGDAREGRLVLTQLTHVAEELFHDVPQRYTPPSRWLPDGLQLGVGPLEAGSHQRDGEARPLRWQTQVEGQGWERVRVPAGEYLTLRVRRRVWFDHPERWRHHNTRTETLWFAPALGFWVRREWSGEYWLRSDRREREVEDWVRFELLKA